jgi:cytochrome c oxidase subunit II
MIGLQDRNCRGGYLREGSLRRAAAQHGSSRAGHWGLRGKGGSLKEHRAMIQYLESMVALGRSAVARALRAVAAAAGLAVGLLSSSAHAGLGSPTAKQVGLQEPATEIMRQIVSFHDALVWIITIITLFVLALLLYVIWRFNETANPTPSRNSHNTTIEVAWTVIPIFILLAIAVPSFKLLYKQYEFPKADVVIKATGHQWYWTHEYPDLGISFDTLMIKDEDLVKKSIGEAAFNEWYGKLKDLERVKRLYADSAPLWQANKMLRMLSVDNEIVLPVNKNVHVLISADDVIHNWTIPSFGIKTDAVPGRTLASWFRAEKTGMFYGQCSELCGKDHSGMPVAVRIVSDEVYAAWTAAMKAKDKKKARDVLIQASIDEETGRRVADAGAVVPSR